MTEWKRLKDTDELRIQLRLRDIVNQRIAEGFEVVCRDPITVKRGTQVYEWANTCWIYPSSLTHRSR